MPSPHLFIFGLGYSAQAIARQAQADGFAVSGTCRAPEKCATLNAQGIEAYPFDSVPPPALAGATHILSSIPPQETGDPVMPHYSGLLPPGAWLGYLSTTGVYGDHQGKWVDEESLAQPDSPRLQRRMVAENQWRAPGGHVFRLAGIYGPGRSAIEDVMRGAARRIDKPGQVFSRIHATDIAQVVLASMRQPHPGRIYNVCDDEPCASAEVIAYACELLGKPLPPLVPFAQAALSPMAMEFYRASRRVHNARIRQELGVRLRYRNYREGLRAIAQLATQELA